MTRRYSVLGGGAGVTNYASGGTTVNVLPKSNGSLNLQDSSITDNGTGISSTLGILTIGAALDTTSGVGIYSTALTGTAQTGLFSNPVSTSAATGSIIGVYGLPQTAAAAFVCAQAASIFAGNPVKGAGSTITTAIGLDVESITVGGSNNYAIRTGTGDLVLGGKATTYNSLTTAGQGFPIILGLTSQKAETTAADANVLTVTPAAAVGTYRVSVAISVASATSGVIAWTLDWTDSNGNAQSGKQMNLTQVGTAAPNVTFTTSAAGNYHGMALIDVNNAAANIVVKWVGGGTTSAKMSACIERLN